MTPPSAENRTGVLLVNSGTPNTLSTAGVRDFLKGLLSDPRVVELPRPLWLPILYAFILPFRPSRVVEKYRKIWMPEGAPLSVFSQRLRRKLKDTLAPIPVEVGMLYSKPTVAAALRTLREAGAERIVVLPLYPQYSGSTTGAAYDKVANELKRWRRLPRLHFLTEYHAEPLYIEALRAGIAEQWAAQGKTPHLLVSFHGIPKSYSDRGDPYHAQCLRTAQRLAESLGLPKDDWSMSFHSRFGAAEWLKPYTIEHVVALAKRGVSELTVICPGFAADCLETVEEIDVENRDAFLAAGGRKFIYVPALNASDAHVELLASLAGRYGGS